MFLFISHADRQKAMKRAYGTVKAMDRIRTCKQPKTQWTTQAVNYMGFLAEIAVCRLLHGQLNVHPLDQADEGFDMTMDGHTIDVKYTYYNTGEMFIKNNGKPRADFYILVTGNDVIMQIKGWATGKDFDNGKTTDYGNRGLPVVSLSQDQLRQFFTFPRKKLSLGGFM